ncbi:MAG: hypothetical protein J2P57_17785, partial [Acidimicrobiaceae bacterium]|nr:hypothetical protein [Acidimicrobiaceae bacterium]
CALGFCVLPIAWWDRLDPVDTPQRSSRIASFVLPIDGERVLLARHTSVQLILTPLFFEAVHQLNERHDSP